MRCLIVLGLGLFAVTMIPRLQILARMQHEPFRFTRIGERAFRLLKFGLGQKRLVDPEEFTPGLAHVFIFGAFMVLITDVWAAHRLVRPFFGTGVLGGFTTFSTYAVDTRRLLAGGHPGTAFAYLLATLLAALTAVWLGATTTRRLVRGRQP